MYHCKYPHLFEPILLGDTLFRNRIFASPTGGQHTHYQNHPINELISYYERKSIGGAASVCVGDAMPDGEHALANGAHILLDDVSGKPHLNKLSENIRRHGAVAAIEISHGGNSARISYGQGHKIYGPCECESVGNFGQKLHAYAMDEDMIRYTIKKFADAALFAKQCGFGMVTLHGGHGWLLHQFMSPVQNTRTDEWGGSFEKRMRFPLAVIAAVREAVGKNFPIEIRISGSECYEGGYDTDYGIKIAEALDGKVDLIHVSAGSHEDSRVFTVTHPSMFLPDGVNVKYAAAIKPHVKTPVATVGALSEPEYLEEIIASGQADVVELARGLICDPDLPNKAREGREDDITHCMRCFTCFSSLMTRGQFCCALNPEISNEHETKFEPKATEAKTVLVAGGGIGGMEAALTAAKRGHRVILCEKEAELGGILRCEEKVPFKKHLDQYLKLQARRVAEAGVEIRLNTEVTPELARELEPQVIVAALGAGAAVPPIPGIRGEKVILAEELYPKPELAGENVVILGGGLVGCELAIFLAGKGKKVTIVEMANALNSGTNLLQGQSIRLEIAKLGIEVRLNSRVTDIGEDGVHAVTPEGELCLPADTVAVALGRKPRREAAAKLALCAPRFIPLGDCVSAATIYQATNAAYYMVRDI